MIAKIIAYGRDRDEALARLRRALRETTVIIEGGTTNKCFLLDLLDQPEVIDGTRRHRLDRPGPRAGRPGRPTGTPTSRCVAAAIDAYEDEEAVERQRLLRLRPRRPPQASTRCGRAVELKLRGHAYRVTVAADRRRAGTGSASDGEPHVDVELDRFERLRAPTRGQRPPLPGRHRHPRRRPPGRGRRRHPPGQPGRGRRVRSPAPALWSSRPRSRSATRSRPGAPVLVLESMKMETVLRAPFAGRVREVLVAVGTPGRRRRAAAAPGADRRRRGRRAEPRRAARRARPAAPSRRGRRPGARARRPGRPAQPAARLRRRPRRRAPRCWPTTCRARPSCRRRPGDSSSEIGLLEVFADLCRAEPQPAGRRGRPDADERVHSPREYFHAYLQLPRRRARGAAASASGQAAPGAGATTASTTWSARPALEDAVYRMFLAQQRAPADVPVVAALLSGWLRRAAARRRRCASASGDALERLVVATQLRYPVVGDLARSVRFRWFDQPLIAAARGRGLRRVREHLTTSPRTRTRRTAPSGSRGLVATPEPLVRLLGRAHRAGRAPTTRRCSR